MALGIFGLMVLVRMVILPIESELVYLTFYPGNAITALLCGLGPGLLAIALAVLVVEYISRSPQWVFNDLSGMIENSALFIVSSLVVVAVIAFFQRRTLQRLDQLEHQAGKHEDAENELVDMRARLAGIIDSAMDAIISVDARQQIVIFNPAAERIFGYAKDEVLGTSLEQLIPLRYREAHQRHFTRFVEDSTSPPVSASHTELLGVRKDGSEFLTEAALSRSAVADDAIFTIMLRDITGRRAVENALIKSRRQLTIFIEQAPISIAMLDCDLNYIAHSRRWPNMNPNRFPDLIGRNHYEVYPDIPERWKQVHREALAGNAAHNDEDIWTRADGTQCWSRWSVLPWHDENGEIGGIIIFTEDITRAKRAESALRASEEDLNRAQAVGHIGSWRLNVKRNELMWSKENYRIFGIPEGTPQTYETFLACVHPDDREEVDRLWQAALHGTPYEITHRIVVDGAIRWVVEKAELEFDTEGNLIGGFGITQDITDIKQVRLALSESNMRFSSFMSHSPVASWIVDASGRYEFVSPLYDKTFNAGMEDLTGKLISDVFPEDEVLRNMQGIQAVIDSDRPNESIESCMMSDGSAGDFLKIRFPIHTADNRLLVGGMALNVTERRQWERQIETANERLSTIASEQATHLRELSGELIHAEQRERDRLYELLHDHVQPMLVAARFELSGIDRRTDPETIQRSVGTVLKQITEAIQAARNLGLQLNPPLIMERGLGPALDSLRNWMLPAYGLKVTLTSEPGIEPADLSVRLLCFNAIRELLLNVAKHAGSDSVAVTLTPEDNEMLKVIVADSGVGFDPEFWHDGTGLLNIQRRLEMVGGSLSIDSQMNAGTIATLLAPRGAIQQKRRLSDRRNHVRIISVRPPAATTTKEYSKNVMRNNTI